jgi:hypothetical protein
VTTNTPHNLTSLDTSPPNPTLARVDAVTAPFQGETLARPRQGPQTAAQVDLSCLPLDELLILRDRIDELMPARTLAEMDLEKELVIQYQAVKALNTRVSAAEDVPVNQLAQVANSISSVLDRLGKMQATMYSHERFKQIELALVRLLKTRPTEEVEAFFREYEELTRGL